MKAEQIVFTALVENESFIIEDSELRLGYAGGEVLFRR
jgi:hypothetical protein